MVDYYDKWTNKTGIIPPNPEEFAGRDIGQTVEQAPVTND
jgi:hypothetical protein